VYAFGAYLIRNYGGPELIKKMLENNAVNEASITAALQSMPGQGSLSFYTALDGYAEALWYSTTNTPGFSTADKMSFDKTTTYTTSGITYTATKFDIWNIQRDALIPLSKGPRLYSLTLTSSIGYSLPGCSLRLHELDNSMTGDLTAVMEIRPGAAVIDMKVIQ